MLSRSAQGLYWMGRYLERARHLSRLLQLQSEALVDRPVQEIYFGWRRIYASVGRAPPGGSLEVSDDDDFILADSFTLADDLTFERSNPESVWQCFWMGRENARQMRNRISGEMWTSLNLSYLRIQKVRIQDIWATSPQGFYAETIAEINRFEGVALTTMYRDDGWRFMQLGRTMERAQQLVSLLLAHMAAEATGEEESDYDWLSLLRIYNAFDAYGQKYGVEVQASQVLDLLVADPQLPSSLSRSLDRASEVLSGFGPAPDEGSSAAARRLVGWLGALVNYDWPDRENHQEFLQQMGDQCRVLHDLVTSTYFEYELV